MKMLSGTVLQVLSHETENRISPVMTARKECMCLVVKLSELIPKEKTALEKERLSILVYISG